MDDIIIDIQIDNDDAVNNIVELTKKIEELKAANKELAKTDPQYIRNSAAIKEYTQQVNNNYRAIKENQKAQEAEVNSLNAKRAALKSMLKQYDNMDVASDAAKALAEQIADLTDEVKELESATGRNQRNVGNYPKVFDLAETSMGKIQGAIMALSNGTGKLSDAAKGAGNSFIAMGKQMFKALANPFVALIAAIVAVVMQLIKAFKDQDDAMTALQSAFAAFQPIIDLFKQGLNALIGVIVKIITAIGNLVKAVASLVPAFKASVESAEALVKGMDALEERERKYTVESAKRADEASELRAKAAERDKYTFKEREKFMQDAIALLRENAEEEKAITDERLRLARLNALKEKGIAVKAGADLAKLIKDNAGKLSDDTKNNLAQLEANAINVTTSFNNQTRELNSQLAGFREAQRKEEEEAVKQSNEKRLAAIKATNEKIKEEEARMTAEEKARYTAKVESLKIQLQIVEKGSAQELAIKRAQLILLMGEELKAAEKTGVDTELIREKYRQLEIDAEKTHARKLEETRRQQVDNTLSALEVSLWRTYDAETSVENKKLENARSRQNELVEMDAATKALLFESDAAYTAAVLQNQKDIQQGEDNLAKIQIAKAQQQMQLVSAMGDVASGVFEMMGEDGKEFLIFQKLLALAEIAIIQAKAIATAIAANQINPDPISKTISIATSIASIMAGIGGVVSAIKATETPNVPKFARGGAVFGAGTATSDSIPAMLSNGESVLNAAATSAFAPILSSFNMMFGGNAIQTENQRMGEEMLARAVAKGVAALNPVVSVEEINRVSNNVRVVETLNRY